jgi:methyl-accepting chemotaxis protein
MNAAVFSAVAFAAVAGGLLIINRRLTTMSKALEDLHAAVAHVKTSVSAIADRVSKLAEESLDGEELEQIAADLNAAAATLDGVAPAQAAPAAETPAA